MFQRKCCLYFFTLLSSLNIKEHYCILLIAKNFVHAFRVETPQILPPNGAKLAVLEGGNLLQILVNLNCGKELKEQLAVDLF